MLWWSLFSYLDCLEAKELSNCYNALLIQRVKGTLCLSVTCLISLEPQSKEITQVRCFIRCQEHLILPINLWGSAFFWSSCKISSLFASFQPIIKSMAIAAGEPCAYFSPKWSFQVFRHRVSFSWSVSYPYVFYPPVKTCGIGHIWAKVTRYRLYGIKSKSYKQRKWASWTSQHRKGHFCHSSSNF